MKNAKLFYSCVLCIQLVCFSGFATENHDAKPLTRETAKKKESSGCEVDSRNLTAFANGESQNFKPLVTFITDESCLNSARSMGLSSQKEGINFDSRYFKLDKLANKFAVASYEELRGLENGLLKRIPGVIINESPKTSELIPIIGQMAVLSPRVARRMLAETIVLELQNSENALNLGKSEMEPEEVKALAKGLMRMGAQEGEISSEIASSVEEKAVLAEADSLKRILISLSSAAKVEPALASTFEFAVLGLNKGIMRGESIYNPKERNALIKVSLLTADSIKEPIDQFLRSKSALDITFALLTNEKPLAQTVLKSMWKDVLIILSMSDRYPQLAQALSESLTFQAIYLGTWDKARLLTAAKNYPQLAFALQKQFVVALDDLNSNLESRRLSKLEYKEKLAKYFVPMVSQILSWDQSLIDAKWLETSVNSGLVMNTDIEKRFPKFVLNLMDRRNKAILSSSQAGVEPVLSSMAENLAVLLNLGTVHVPTLNKWVEETEE